MTPARRVLLRAQGQLRRAAEAIEFRITGGARDAQRPHAQADDRRRRAADATITHRGRTRRRARAADEGPRRHAPSSPRRSTTASGTTPAQIRAQLAKAGISDSGIDRAVTDSASNAAARRGSQHDAVAPRARGCGDWGHWGHWGDCGRRYPQIRHSPQSHSTHGLGAAGLQTRAFCDRCNEYTITAQVDDNDYPVCSVCGTPRSRACRCKAPALGDPGYVEGYCTDCTNCVPWHVLAVKWKPCLVEGALVDDLIDTFDAIEIGTTQVAA